MSSEAKWRCCFVWIVHCFRNIQQICAVGNQNFTAIPLVQACCAWLSMYLILRLCFCDVSLLYCYKMWFCILDTINSTLGRLFLVPIVEGKGDPMACLGRRTGEGEVYCQSVFIPALKWGGWAAPRSCRFTLVIEPSTSCKYGWMGLGFGLDDSIPGRSIPLWVAIPTMLVLIVHIIIGHVRVRQRLVDWSWCRQ
jgi:hypothetical protein